MAKPKPRAKRKPAIRDLTHRERRFVQEFLTCWHGAEACERAGYKRGESAKIMRRPIVREALRKAQESYADGAAYHKDRVLEEEARLAYSNITSICSFGPEGVVFKKSEDLPDYVTAAIQEVSETRTVRVDHKGGETTTVTVRAKMHPKQPALQYLARLTGAEPIEPLDVRVSGKVEHEHRHGLDSDQIARLKAQFLGIPTPLELPVGNE